MYVCMRSIILPTRNDEDKVYSTTNLISHSFFFVTKVNLMLAYPTCPSMATQIVDLGSGKVSMMKRMYFFHQYKCGVPFQFIK